MRAVIFATAGIGSLELPPVDPGTCFLGLTLLRRSILAAWKAGASAAWLVCPNDTAVRRWTASETDLPIPVSAAVGLPDSQDWDGSDPVLVLTSSAIVPDSSLRRLVREPAPAIIRDGDRPEPLAALTTAGGLAGMRDVAQPAGFTPQILPGIRLLDSYSLQAAARLLFSDLISPSDGWIDRVFSRRISRPITERLLPWSVSPNQVTTSHFLIGLCAAALFWTGEFWPGVAGGVLLQFSVALDCVDGEIARLKYQFSSFGSWWDVVADNIVTIACFVSIAHAAIPRLGVPTAIALGVAAAVGVAMCVLTIVLLSRLLERSRPGRASPLAATNRLSSTGHGGPGRGTGLLTTVINEAASRDFTILIVGFVLVGRPEWFAWLAGVGSHVFWIGFGGYQLYLMRDSGG